MEWWSHAESFFLINIHFYVSVKRYTKLSRYSLIRTQVSLMGKGKFFFNINNKNVRHLICYSSKELQMSNIRIIDVSLTTFMSSDWNITFDQFVWSSQVTQFQLCIFSIFHSPYITIFSYYLYFVLLFFVVILKK